MSVGWRVNLSVVAKRDFIQILKDSKDRFGPVQAQTYKTVILAAISALRVGPDVLGSKVRQELPGPYRSLHGARIGRHGRRHILICRAIDGMTIDVIRILHDRMDIARHLPSDME